MAHFVEPGNFKVLIPGRFYSLPLFSCAKAGHPTPTDEKLDIRLACPGHRPHGVRVADLMAALTHAAGQHRPGNEILVQDLCYHLARVAEAWQMLEKKTNPLPDA